MNQQSHSLDTVVHLIPVIEMPPMSYMRVDRITPSPNSPDDEWDQYWSDCLADSGIVGLQPIRSHSWHVSLDQLTDGSTLEQILYIHFLTQDDDVDESKMEIDPENLLAFSGGYALSIGGQVMITPRCCADLTDITQWHAAAAHRCLEKIMVWIGHPWIEVQFDGTHLVFTEETDGQYPAEWLGECSVEPHTLLKAIYQAEQELLDFFGVLLPIVEKTTLSARAIEITTTLTACSYLTADADH